MAWLNSETLFLVMFLGEVGAGGGGGGEGGGADFI